MSTGVDTGESRKVSRVDVADALKLVRMAVGGSHQPAGKKCQLVFARIEKQGENMEKTNANEENRHVSPRDARRLSSNSSTAESMDQ